MHCGLTFQNLLDSACARLGAAQRSHAAAAVAAAAPGMSAAEGVADRAASALGLALLERRTAWLLSAWWNFGSAAAAFEGGTGDDDAAAAAAHAADAAAGAAGLRALGALAAGACDAAGRLAALAALATIAASSPPGSLDCAGADVGRAAAAAVKAAAGAAARCERAESAVRALRALAGILERAPRLCLAARSSADCDDVASAFESAACAVARAHGGAIGAHAPLLRGLRGSVRRYARATRTVGAPLGAELRALLVQIDAARGGVAQ
jgi:hypothetical protein